MERTEKPVRPKLEYRVLFGKLYIFGKKFTKGEVFEAYPEEIPAFFMDKLVCISDEARKAATIQEPDKSGTKEDLYEVIKRADTRGWYDVVNKKTGKPINEDALRLPKAEELRDTLNA